MTVARLGSQRVVVAAASVTIVLAIVLLTALWVYVGAAATAGVRAAIAPSPASTTGLSIHTTTKDRAELSPLDDRVRALVDRTFSQVPYDIAGRYLTSDTYTLPTNAGGDAEELTIFGWYSDVEAHVDITDGSWPGAVEAAAEPVEVAMHRDAAATLGLAVGDSMTVVQRLDDIAVEVTLAATFVPREAADWYWRSDPLDTTGSAEGSSFTTRGPLLVADPEIVVAGLASSGVTREWHVGPRWARSDAAAIAETGSAVRALLRDLPAEGPPVFTGSVVVETGLDDILTSVQRALVSNRSMMTVPLLQLAVLATYTLLLAAQLLTDHRRGESALLRARGMSTRQVVGLTVRESALLVVPVVAVAPIAAAVLLRLVDGRGPFGALGDAVGGPAVSWWAVSAIAGVLCALALVLPSMRSGTYVETQSARGRSGRRGAAQRAGLDLLLLVGAVISYAQLRRYEAPVLSNGSAAQIDPLLVLGPCLTLLAAAALSVRLLTLVAGVAQRIAGRGSSVGPALGAWQVARRPLRYSGPALLLVLALAIGAMSTTYSASWRQSQLDQATFTAGADVRVTAATDRGSTPVLGQASTVSSLPGAEAVAPALRTSVRLGDRTVALVAIDADAAPRVLRMRDDLSSHPPAELLAPLSADRWGVDGVPLPGEPTSLTATLTAAARPVDPIPADLQVQPGWMELAVRDAAGNTIRLDPSVVQFDGSEQEVTVDLTSAAQGETRADVQPAYPLTVVGARIVLPTPVRYGSPVAAGYTPYRSTLEVTAFAIDDAPLRVTDRPAWQASSGGGSFFDVGPVAALPTGLLAVEVTSLPTGDRTQTVTVVAGTPGADMAAVLDRTAASAAGVTVGDLVRLPLGSSTPSAEVVDVVDAFPGTDPSTGVVIVDYSTLAAARWLGAAAATAPTEWWISSSDQALTAQAALGVPGLAAGQVTVDGLAATFQEDPLGASTLGALLAGFVAALGFAAVAFAVNLVIGARERMAEFAVLRALGVSRRQVNGTLLVEQAFLVGLGVAVGMAIGLTVSALVVPLVLISPRSARIVPPVLLDIPWLALALTAAGSVLLLGLLVAVSATRLQRAGLGGVVRLGGDT